MKLSNRLLLLLAAALLILAGSYGFYVGKNIKQKETIITQKTNVSKTVLELADIVKNDTVYYDFEHLVFEMNRIRTEVNITDDVPSNIVFQNSFKQFDPTKIFEFEKKGDTLYVREKLDIFNYKFSTGTLDNSGLRNPADIKLDIYTNNLKSIVLQKMSNVKVQTLESSSKRSFLPELMVKQSYGTIFKVENLNLGSFNHHRFTNKKFRFDQLSLYLDNGSARSLNFHDLNANLEAFDFPADSIYIKEASDNQHNVEVYANEYLNVDLAGKGFSFIY
ncbi:MAG: hypothetical protein AAFO82_19050, partial [Bacteroidota bacterium]